MFVCHTPPFRGRGRRGPCRGWRTNHGPHGSGFCMRRHGFPFHIHPCEVRFNPVEIYDNELEDVGHEYTFRRAIPGIPPEQLEVVVEGPMLTVRTLTEVPGQRFEWRVAIPDDVSSECITAEVTNGFLHVRMPKMLPRAIPVSVSNTDGDLWKLEHWGSEYRLTHPAPGVHPNDVVVNVEEGFIFVKVQGPNARFSREVSLPPAVDVDAIMVDIENGQLIVTLPKYERDEIRVHCATERAVNGAGPSAPPDNHAISDEENALYDEARRYEDQ